MKIGKKEFDLLRQQIYRLCGLSIPDGKEYLIEHRFAPIFQDRGCKTWMEFYKLLQSSDVGFKDEIISAISTHETSFFRDNYPFTSIKQKVLPQLVNGRKSRRGIRIWCAASSTGQEPYSLAMLIHEFCNSPAQKNISPKDFSILATDISEKVLSKASNALFSKLDVDRGLPDGFTKYFKQEGRSWRLNEDVRSLVSFKKFNLLNSFNPLGKFDFVLCRNVLIYFDDATKVDIVHRIHALLPDNAYLMLGATETLSGHTDRFEAEHIGPVILYRKKNGAGKTKSMIGRKRAGTERAAIKFKKPFSAR
ncbi:CheR family methyltransferase [Maridesulfovibrio hydrothermalis]|uniref:protein-glutamate O-methyltransferase n=1 Tax=Maridesulfovibrio hydrothermalis AM13 = DSM 14728 TaxID=1121451 RepID=L0RFB6_9BACT|nr:protein-glutamate O-methyltransferase CheR [Maridesulfovibrio hydrothermalis]CCO25429.1 MCP methyltransferase, CheR-type [Maridesulfovibrio hydrothermalis AM13 = DSM 14728]